MDILEACFLMAISTTKDLKLLKDLFLYSPPPNLQAVEEDVIQNSISILNNTQRLAEDM